MVPLAMAAVSGGISLASGLFGRSDDKKARREAQRIQDENQRRVEAMNSQQEQRVERANQISAALGEQYTAAPMVKLGELVRDAEAFGFNPLTYLRAGAASLYGKAVDLPGYQMRQVQHIASPEIFQASALPQVRGIGSVVAGAAADAFATFSTQSNIQQQQAFQERLLNTSLAAVAAGRKAGNSKAGSFLNVPGMNTAGSKTVTKPPQIGFGGNMLRTDNSTTNAEECETRYGDEGPASWMCGLGVAYFDAKEHTKAEPYGPVGWIDKNIKSMPQTWVPRWYAPESQPEATWWNFQPHMQRRAWTNPQ